MQKVFRFIKAIFCWCVGGCKVSTSAEGRMQICQKCKHFSLGVCSLCGCLLKYKTKLKTEKCPKDKW